MTYIRSTVGDNLMTVVVYDFFFSLAMGIEVENEIENVIDNGAF